MGKLYKISLLEVLQEALRNFIMSDGFDSDKEETGVVDDDEGSEAPKWNRGQFPAWNSELGALETARQEGRESLTQTISSIDRIDETAMVTLRIDLVIIGLALTAVSSFPSTLQFTNALSTVGFACLSGSALMAIVTTMGSDYPTGVSEDYLQEVQHASWTTREWNEWMVREYSRWLADANEMENGDAQALFITQLLLVIGLILLIAGILAGVSGIMEPSQGVAIANDSV